MFSTGKMFSGNRFTVYPLMVCVLLLGFCLMASGKEWDSNCCCWDTQHGESWCMSLFYTPQFVDSSYEQLYSQIVSNCCSNVDKSTCQSVTNQCYWSYQKQYQVSVSAGFQASCGANLDGDIGSFSCAVNITESVTNGWVTSETVGVNLQCPTSCNKYTRCTGGSKGYYEQIEEITVFSCHFNFLALMWEKTYTEQEKVKRVKNYIHNVEQDYANCCS